MRKGIIAALQGLATVARTYSYQLENGSKDRRELADAGEAIDRLRDRIRELEAKVTELEATRSVICDCMLRHEHAIDCPAHLPATPDEERLSMEAIGELDRPAAADGQDFGGYYGDG